MARVVKPNVSAIWDKEISGSVFIMPLILSAVFTELFTELFCWFGNEDFKSNDTVVAVRSLSMSIFLPVTDFQLRSVFRPKPTFSAISAKRKSFATVGLRGLVYARPSISLGSMDFSNNRIDTQRRTVVYVRISTSMQKTDRQVEELVTFAKENKLNFNEKKDIYRDVISGFKDGEYQQLLFSEFSRLDRKPSNLLRTLETLQKQDVYCWFNKQSIWVKDKNDIGTQIMIQVLAVLSQYEIELFTARGIDGKITALKTRGTTNVAPAHTDTGIPPKTANSLSTPQRPA